MQRNNANLSTQGNGKRWSGITVDGKSLDSYFEKEKEKQTDAEVQAIYSEEKDDKGKRRKVRVPDKTETKPKRRNSKMTTLKQSQINVKNFETMLNSTKALGKRIIIHLLAGKNFTGPEYQKWQKEAGHTVSKQQIWSLLSSITRSGLGEYIARTREIYDGNKMFRYAMTPDGIELTPKQAFQLFGKAPMPKKKKEKKAVSKKAKTVEEKPLPGQSQEAKPAPAQPAVGLSSNNLHVTVDVYFHLKFS